MAAGGAGYKRGSYVVFENLERKGLKIWGRGQQVLGIVCIERSSRR